MKYLKPEMEVIKFEADVLTDIGYVSDYMPEETMTVEDPTN